MYSRFFGFILSVFVSFTLVAAASPIAVRAAIDLGTGGPKLQVAEVNLETGKIVKIVHTEQFFVNFHQSLRKNSHFSEEIKAKGLEAFKKAIEKSRVFNPDGIVAVATAAFRHAKNGLEFAQEIQEETGIKVHVIDQLLEGTLPFLAVLAKIETAPQHLLVWDVGGRSIQFVGTDLEGICHIDGSNEGSGPFRDYIIEKIQGRSIDEYNSPNPISAVDVGQALAYGRYLSEKVDPSFQNKIKATHSIIGVGSVFKSISKIVGKTSFTQEELAVVVNALINKTDEDLGGGDFACVEASNAILVLGFMEGLQIERLEIIHVNNADGALTHGPFWNP